MKKAIVLEQKDIKSIIAKHFNVSEQDVIKSQYSYTVVMDESADCEPDAELGE